jgi:type VI secretion system protein ImpK
MSEKDPFADFDSEPEDLERTIIMPAPGGRRRAQAEPPMPPRPAPRPEGPRITVDSAAKNPLIRAAATAFALVRRLRNSARHDNVDVLRDSVLAMVKEFEAKARNLGAATETSYAARYALCALIDETVLATPWGSQSSWTTESLLGTLHNETRGGAKFFQILERMSENPARNIDLLEFLYLCLSLGFQGKYAVMDRGSAELEAIAQELYRTIRNQRGEGERELSPHWRGVADRRPVVARYIPLWTVPVGVCALAVALYLGFSYSINSASDDVFTKLNKLGGEAAQLYQRPASAEPLVVETVAVASDEPPPPPPAVRIGGQLQEEVERGVLEVVDLGYATNIVVHNKGLFPSGSARVSNDYRPVILKIGEVLKNEPGPLLVTGHTDKIPIRTLKFPSNWHLSDARAKAVVALMSESVGDSNKLVAEGRADTELIAPGDNAADHQRNRRIEIKIPVN